ncbi:uncharacterized protein TEOVI_000764300 [Trypanosoma equiperdum]|uniref:Uncharacterized protein n=1 Tax=Trypanosoma equiperdum TaxID=5694 RepID=A0A1G4I2U6_TRYEQ|nr:hypothetical protein TEOVI_000764300 [Trypanosoma equiperdum]
MTDEPAANPNDDLLKIAAYEEQKIEDYNYAMFKTAEVEIIEEASTEAESKPRLIKLLAKPLGTLDQEQTER